LIGEIDKAVWGCRMRRQHGQEEAPGTRIVAIGIEPRTFAGLVALATASAFAGAALYILAQRCSPLVCSCLASASSGVWYNVLKSAWQTRSVKARRTVLLRAKSRSQDSVPPCAHSSRHRHSHPVTCCSTFNGRHPVASPLFRPSLK